MKLWLHINDYNWPIGTARYAPALAEIARAAEAAGFGCIGVADHVWQDPHVGGPELPELECYGTLAYLAAHTRRVGLLAIVSGVHFRHPGMLAKQVTTLDVLSGGRAWLGIGAGHYEAEARGLGIPFPPLGERFAQVEETVQICLRMWSGERGDERPFAGRQFRLERPLNLPQSLSRPHPPILIGGAGERKGLRLVARYADACNLFPTPDLPRKLAALRRHCEAEGRDYAAIEKTCALPCDVGERGERVGELIGQLRWLAGMGIETAVLAVAHVEQIAPLELIGREVLPAVAELEPAAI